MDVIIPTWAEVNCWIALLAIALIGLGIWFWWHNRHGDLYVDWVRDWGERG